MPTTTGFNTLMYISYRVGGELIGNASWTGVALRDVLLRAGVDPEAAYLKFTSADNYEESLPIAAAMHEDVRLVWRMNNAPLTRKHGFPLRALVPGRYGMKNPKWITRLTLEREEAEGYWAARGWSHTAFVQTMSRFDVPGRNSRIVAGLSALRGIAFAGERGISGVEISTDHGETWNDARVHQPLSDFTWVRWQYDFEARPPGTPSSCAPQTGAAQRKCRRRAILFRRARPATTAGPSRSPEVLEPEILARADFHLHSTRRSWRAGGRTIRSLDEPPWRALTRGLS